ncbi:TrmH family RNA methyltransferase, partial [Myxococcota bacterium]|nr:TrmH family RNA methyltransferase [Myxococcota bacterium]MBU1896853.1 TrmH family RNA methyltransferase [Myxococcota bacterium]
LHALAEDADAGVAWLARAALAGRFTPEALTRRLGPHARSDAASARPPYGIRPGDALPEVQRAEAALALCHTRFDMNLGVAVRSAEAAGLREVFLLGRGDLFRSPARGTDALLPIHVISDAAALIRRARAEGYQIVAVQQTPDSVSYIEADYPPRPLFVLGAEDSGVPEPLRLAADLIVEIPMFGVIDSLNVAAAATTVMLYWRAAAQQGSPSVALKGARPAQL